MLCSNQSPWPKPRPTSTRPRHAWATHSRVRSRSRPIAYVIGRRLQAARERILGGQPLADVAAEVGFVDQAHLTRRFKQFLGRPRSDSPRVDSLDQAGR